MNTSKPSWWTNLHTSAWDKIREAMKRDWEQTKHDFSKKSGHELNQDVGDTVKQAVGEQPIPPADRPNPPEVIGDWDDVELPMGYGYGAKLTYGQEHAQWDPAIDSKLEKDWNDYPGNGQRPWDRVQPWVRRGYEYNKN